MSLPLRPLIDDLRRIAICSGVTHAPLLRGAANQRDNEHHGDEWAAGERRHPRREWMGPAGD